MSFRDFHTGLLGAAALAIAALGSAPAFAGVVVDFPIGLAGGITINNTNVGSATQDNFGTSTYFVNNPGSDDQTGAFTTEPLTLGFAAPTNFVLGNNTLSPTVVKTFDTTGSTSCGGVPSAPGCTKGPYSVTFTSLFAFSSAPGALNWILSGTLTPPSGPTQPDFLSAAFTQVTSGGTVNVSFTETSTQPIIGTPEPASMALVGVGLLGLGAARGRKRGV